MSDIIIGTDSSVEKNAGKIRVTDESVNIIRKTNHNEISIMEERWRNIQNKCHQIKIGRPWNISAIILGAWVPSIVEVMVSLVRQQTPNWAPVAIYGIVFGVSVGIKYFCPSLGDGNIAENKVHLNDLQRMIDEINLNE